MRWFADRDVLVTVEHVEGSVFWAHLLSATTNEVVAAQYGSGRNALEAVRRARARYEVEQ
jgi:hypothetical protein